LLSLADRSASDPWVQTWGTFDLKYKQQAPSLLPYGIYTIPECSMVGETEESAQRRGIRYTDGRACYRNNVNRPPPTAIKAAI